MKVNKVTTNLRSILYALPLTVIGTSAIANESTEARNVERIEVTGSRIKRIGELSPSPVTVITGDSLVEAGVVNVADLLHKMPSTLVGLSPETSNNFIFASGLNTTDLRGLGESRTLVLVNGRRFVAGAPGSSAVDLNNIPTAIIERVEITTGGASAVYGSDAVAGVVNIITKKSYDGVTVDLSTSRPSQKGGEEEYASFTFGSSAGKASFISNLSFARQKQISFMDRDFLRDAPIVVRNTSNIIGEPAQIFWGLGRQVRPGFTNTGSFVSNGKRYTFDASGKVREQILGEELPTLPSGHKDYLGGEGYNFAEVSFMRTPLDRINFVSNMNYELSNAHQLTMEVNYSRTKAYGESSPAFLGFSLKADNAFLSPEAAELVRNANEDASVSVGYLANDFGNRQYFQERTLARFALGLEGEISENWNYQTYITSGHVQADSIWKGEMFEQRFYQAVDAIKNSDGEIVCRDATARANGCVPLNVFGRELYDQRAYDWVSTDAIRRSSIQQHVAGISVSGDILELPAGWLSSALSAEYRKEIASTLPDPAMRSGQLFNNKSDPLYGKFDVSELSAEFSVPLISDIVLAKNVTLEVAGRYMDYSVTGSDTAWKLGLNWEVYDDLRVRLNKSKSVRAPNIGELFNPPGQTFRRLVDPCAVSSRAGLNETYRQNILNNCAAQGIPEDFEPTADWFSSTRPGFIIGNTELSNEVAKDITVGFVFTPSTVKGLSLTMDYWAFDMSDVINRFQGPDVVNYCYQSSSLDNPFCPLIERDPETFDIINYFEKPINSALSKTAGVDTELNYRFDTDIGAFGFRMISTYLQTRKFNATGFAEDEVDNTGEQLRPRWKHRFITDYSFGNLSAALTVNHRSASVLSNRWTPNQNNFNDVPSYTTFDLTSRYRYSDALELRLGLLNMFDKTPPRRPFMYNQGGAYDMIGQRLTVGISYDF
ncbi:TonB-dependent receptor [Alishewanella longhuensis]|uniref:TonB-dependent receptor n=1 Tax=Alishewanella longhuensis TaxID=1091037 RepID=A0ABQ3L1K6_9ALTE|nr:TonB-dependent receptor [Alishewanella longhuensis]GHG58933.1 TonB-dependent receptor [Alishewanella longhuensis]